MSAYEESPTYIGDIYRHVETGFTGEVVKEVVPTPWTPDGVVLTLERNGERRQFPLTQLVGVEEA
jgi:hypothetical protein